MKIVEINEKNLRKYSEFVQNHPFGTVHQILEWGEFQKKGRDSKYWLLALEDSHGQIQASVLILRQNLPFKKCWLYCPRGPLVDYSKPEQLTLLFTKIAEIAKQENAIFLRFDPPLLQEDFDSTASTKQLKSDFQSFLKARLAHAHYQPEHTLILDVSKPLDQILQEMKPKGRYNIKVAQKHNVTIRVSENNKEDIEAFYRLFTQTTTRDKFSGHSLNYYQNMLQAFTLSKNRPETPLHPHAKLYLAEYEGKAIAGAITTYFNTTATYYFGASSNEYRNTMAPYLLHWQIIQDAQKSGYQYYDFFGISPENEPNHAWAGVTDFKLKFGGKRVNYLPAQEIVYQQVWYLLMRLAKRLKRGL